MKKKIKKTYFRLESVLSCKIPESHAKIKNITEPKGRGVTFWPVIVVT